MAGVIKRSEFIFEHEILKSGAGLDDILSETLAAQYVNESFSGVSRRYVVPAGSVMVWVPGDSKKRVAPLFMNDGTTGMGALMGTGTASAYQAADIAGILSRTIELIVGDETASGAAPTSASDTDASLLHLGAHFDIRRLFGYNPAVDAAANGFPQANHGADNSAAVKAALALCKFD